MDICIAIPIPTEPSVPRDEACSATNIGCYQVPYSVGLHALAAGNGLTRLAAHEGLPTLPRQYGGSHTSPDEYNTKRTARPTTRKLRIMEASGTPTYGIIPTD